MIGGYGLCTGNSSSLEVVESIYSDLRLVLATVGLGYTIFSLSFLQPAIIGDKTTNNY